MLSATSKTHGENLIVWRWSRALLDVLRHSSHGGQGQSRLTVFGLALGGADPFRDVLQERDAAVGFAEHIREKCLGSSPELKHLFTRMAQDALPGMRLTAVQCLRVWGQAERWGQAWMLELLACLRGDDSPMISREALNLFCFSE